MANFDEVRRAADNLRAERALAEQKIVVFLSHLSQDADSAQMIQEVLDEYGAGKVEVWLAPDISKGKQWRQELKKALHRADWFILLYSGAALDWSWCHEEAGAFLGMRHFHTDRLTVFYPEAIRLPGFLEEFQSVQFPSMSVDEVERLMHMQDNVLELPPFRGSKVFLESFFNVEPYPKFGALNPKILSTKDFRNRIVLKLVDAVGRLTTSTHGLRYTMSIEIPDPSEITLAFPKNALVYPGSAGEELFNTGREKCFWPDFFAKLGAGSARDIWGSIAAACRKATDTRRLQPIYRVFSAIGSLKRYRPLLIQLETAGNKSCRIRLAFVEALEPEIGHDREAKIVTSVTFAYRFRTQILDRFGTQIKLQNFLRNFKEQHREEGKSADELERNALLEIKEAIDDIVREATDHGLDAPDVADHFSEKEDREWAAEAYGWWYKAQELLYQALEMNNQEAVMRLLKEMEPLNSAFIEVATSCVVGFVAKRAEPNRTLPDLTAIRDELSAGKAA